MEITSIIVLAGLGISAVIAMRLFYNAFKKASEGYDKKLADDYRKAVEEHQLSDMRMSTYPDPPPKRKFERVKVVDKASRSTGDFLSVPSQLVDSNFNLYGLDISSDKSNEVSGISHYEGAGHGGSFGGGGSSGSWGSDDSSSSSYDSSSSDSGGSDSSSSD